MRLASGWRDRLQFACLLFLCVAFVADKAWSALHRHRQLLQLQAALRQDGERAVADSIQEEADCAARLPWLQTRLAQTDTAIQGGTPLPPAVHATFPGGNFPEDTVWKAARSSGLQALLPQEDLDAYWELDYLFSMVDTASQRASEASNRRVQFQIEFKKPEGGYSVDSPDLLREYRGLLLQEISAQAVLRFYVWTLHGAQAAVLRGERNLAKIEDAESQFMQ